MKSLIQKMVETLKETEGIEQTAEILIVQAYDEGFKAGVKYTDVPVPKPKPVETDQRHRDGIVQKAKDFVERYQRRGDGNWFNIHRSSPKFKYTWYETNFHIKDNKVTAVIYGLNFGKIRNKKPLSVGRAKCNPDDCFNKWIGMAIALYRALGLDVPRMFLNVPQPTEVRVGNVVDLKNLDGVTYRRTVKTIDGKFGRVIYKNFGHDQLEHVKTGTIINDSESEPNDH